MLNKVFPFTRDGRQTLIYIVLALCGPVLTVCTLWAMREIELWTDVSAAERLDRFCLLAYMNSIGLLIIVAALSCFVSIRAIKISRDGFEATGSQGDKKVDDA